MDKRGLSNLVAYVFLIAITISLSILVYGWLKFYVSSGDVADCPEGVNLVINDYTCSPGAFGNLSVKIKNRGLFSVDGFILRVSDNADSEFGIYSFDDEGFSLKPGEEVNVVYNFSDYSYGITDVVLVDVQPFLDDGKRSFCNAVGSQEVICNG